MCGAVQDVGVGEQNEVCLQCFRLRQPLRNGPHLAAPALRQRFAVEYAQAHILRSEGVRDRARGIGAVVINDDDVQFAFEVLLQKSFKAFAEVLLLVARRDDDGDA